MSDEYRSLFWALCVVALLPAACARREQVLRPSCHIRVLDDKSGLPLPGVKVVLLTLGDDKDTVGTWPFVTDADGSVHVASIRAARPDPAGGRRYGRYTYVASFEYDVYRYYSQRITGSSHTIHLGRKSLVACRAKS